MTPSVLALATDTAPPQIRGALLGIFGSFRNAGKAAGPILLTLVSTKLGPQAIYPLCILLPLLAWMIKKLPPGGSIDRSGQPLCQQSSVHQQLGRNA